MVENSPPRPEFDFIDWVSNQSQSRPEVLLGIGDDAAVLAQPPGRDWVTAVDVITEGVHFTETTPPALIGRKSLAINLSDLAAMAAEPVAAFIGIVLPKSRGRRYAEQVYRGIFEIAREYQVSIAGGDTNSWDGPLVLSVTLQGTVQRGGATLRSGARVGDWIFVTGSLGGSLESGRHLTFTPRIHEARELVDTYHVTAMLDLSDGLASDIRHLARRSEVGIRIEAESLPIHPDVSENLSQDDRIQHALMDGEDFELLLTVSPEEGQRLERAGSIWGTNVTRIGVCTSEREILLQSGGVLVPMPEGGWTHQFIQPAE